MWIEVLVIVCFYYSYTASRAVADGSVEDALGVGWDLLRIQTDLNLDFELGLNRWLQGVPVLAVASCYYYATFHFVVTPAILVWLYRKRPGHYLRARWTLVATTVISLAGFFLLPTAPPRLLAGAGFVDTMAWFHDWGWWGGSSSAAPRGLGAIANQFAAMPSLHCAWALWCGWILAAHARRRRVKVLGVVYPLTTAFVVVATANHYVLDVIAGWFVAGLGGGVAMAVMRLAHGRSARPPAIPTPTPRPGETPGAPGPGTRVGSSDPADEVPASPDLAELVAGVGRRICDAPGSDS